MNTQAQDLKRPEQLLQFSLITRLPVIVQSEVAECGLACVGMIAGYHGYEIGMTGLRRMFSISNHGTTLKDLMTIASRLHFSTRAIRLEVESVMNLQLPCILHWNLNHFVVLKAVKKNHYILHDPAFGERKIEKKIFDREFTGVALELTPSTSFQKSKNKETLAVNHFWKKIIGFKRSLAQIIALSLLLQIFSIAAPFYMQIIVDDVLLRQDENLLIVLALGFSLLMIIQVGTTALRSTVVLHLSNRLGIQMSANLFRHLIRLPMEYFAKRHMGDIVSRFGALSFVRSALTENLVSAVVDGCMAIITLIAMFLYDVNLTFIVISIVLLYGLLRWVFFRPSQALTQETIIASAQENTHFMESMRAIQTIKLFQRENDRQNQWQNRLADVMNKNIQLARWGIWFGIINGILFGIENILVIYFAAKAVMGNIISLGMLYGFISYKTSFRSSMDRLITQWINFQMLGLYMNRLADIAFTQAEDIDKYLVGTETRFSPAVDSRPEPNAPQSPKINPQILRGKIEVRNLAYRYGESGEPAFKNVSFIIQPGEKIAITGASGCGKSTLLKCLMGLIDPIEGEILIDDQPVKKILHYRSQIASVMQEDQLLSGDIAENIACFSSEIDHQKVYLCARLACIHDEIIKMPMGYNTLVGDMGAGLSSGQKQRVVLARALYREPRILFMDEATSHLDVTNEAHINHNMQQLNITRVFVAHRLLTIRAADRVIEL